MATLIDILGIGFGTLLIAGLLIAIRIKYFTFQKPMREYFK